MSIGAPMGPLGRLAGLVVRKLNVAGMPVSGTIPQLVASLAPVLMTVAKAVAGVPTCTERLLGNTAAISVGAPSPRHGVMRKRSLAGEASTNWGMGPAEAVATAPRGA